MSKAKGWFSKFVTFDDDSEAKASDTDVADLSPEEMSSADIEALLQRTRTTTSEAKSTVPVTEIPKSTPASKPMTELGSDSMSSLRSSSSNVAVKTFDQIYADSGCVAPSPKPVEQILALLDGIKNMPEAVQAQVLTASAEADASWTLEDVVLDAKNKILACNQYKATLTPQIEAAKKRLDSDLAACDTLISETHQTIDAEIADLEKQIQELRTLRDQEVSSAEASKSSARSQFNSTTEACQREAVRVDGQVQKLQNFIHTFGPKAQGDSQ